MHQILTSLLPRDVNIWCLWPFRVCYFQYIYNQSLVSHSFLVQLGSFYDRWESTSLANHWESIWHCLALLSLLNIVSLSVFIQFAWFNLQMKSVHWSIGGDIYKYLVSFVYGSKRSKGLYQSWLLLSWVYLTCRSVLGHITLCWQRLFIFVC